MKKIVIHTEKDSSALLKLFFNKADIAVIPKNTYETAIELNPQIQKNITTLYESPKIFLENEITLIHKKSSPRYQKAFLISTKRLLQSKDGKSIASYLTAKEFVTYSIKDLTPMINLNKTYAYKAGL